MASPSTLPPTAAPSNKDHATPASQKSKSAGTAQPQRLYAVVWRWHFYAGLLVAPIFLLITITGALYVFRTELTSLRDRAVLYVTPEGERKSYEELHAIADEAIAPREIEAVIVHPEQNRSLRFVADASVDDEQGHGHHEHLQVYMNPWTGQILDQRIAEADFFAIVLDLHRSLMLGTTGRVLGELATSWGLLLLATGIYLWWPRGKKNVGVWRPRITGKLYPVLRDWHAVSGIYLLPLAALIIGTGMFFTVVWGSTFNKSVQAAGHWPKAWFGDHESLPPTEETAPASLDRVVQTVLQHARPEDNISIILAKKPTVAHKAWYLQDEDKNSYKMVAIDQYTGEKVASMTSNEVPALYKVRLLAVSIHMGQIFGLSTKILALLTSIGLMALSVTGVWMWWKRRPRGRSGFPRRPAAADFPRWGWLVVLFCAIVLPLAGISFIVVGLIDWLLARRSRAVAAV